MKVKRIIDASRKIYPGMTLFTGDRGVVIKRAISIETGGIANVSSITMSLHTGTHIDAPYHFIKRGNDIASVDLSRFIGPSKVFELDVKTSITAHDLSGLPINEDDIIIFKTSNSYLPETEKFSEKFICLDVSAADFLIEKKVKTIGVDSISTDDFQSNDFPIHILLLSGNIGIIEGLRLQDVSQGEYFLSCLPLNIEGAEASPARAVLMEFED
jgi:arylformamidase